MRHLILILFIVGATGAEANYSCPTEFQRVQNNAVRINQSFLRNEIDSAQWSALTAMNNHARRAVELSCNPSAASDDDYCSTELAKNKQNAQKINDLYRSGSINEFEQNQLLAMNAHAKESVQIACGALTHDGAGLITNGVER
jgi:hypothetical protein